MTNTESLKRIIDQISRDKGIDRTLLVEAIEEAVRSAARKKFGSRRDIEVQFSEATGEIEVFQYRTVVEEINKRGVKISTKNLQRCRDLVLGFAAVILMAGCASSPQATETALPATPEPSGLHCIHESWRYDLCYAEDSIAEDAYLLEKTIRDFCLHSDRYWCYFYIWRDEGSVADSIPLSDAQAASLFARFTSNPNSGLECFQIFDNGEVIHSTGNCE